MSSDFNEISASSYRNLNIGYLMKRGIFMDNIKTLKRLFNNYLNLNKVLVDQAAIAVVPARKTGNLPISDLDIEEDYIYYCFTKFTKTMIAIENLLKNELYEDALILVRSNYECLVNAKSIIKNDKMIDHLIDYKLGLLNQKKYDFVKSKKGNNIWGKISPIKDKSIEIAYISNISQIAEVAEEETSYKYIYSYLCDITHCNMVTSPYYREGIQYTYKLANDLVLFNVLLWSIYFNLKFYNTLIDSEILEIQELEDSVLDILISDQIKVLKFFEDEEKRIIKELNAISDEEEKIKCREYLVVLESLKRNAH